ncbi:MAG TPA: YHS domain-containing protein [Ignavibacteriaceae bacterium]|nr:YHS domain-containing protein [Ignavibacteriaceae bacterium]
MLKQFVIIISMFVIFSSLIIAQEKPQEQKEEAKQDSLVETVDSSTAVESTELKIWNKVCPVMGNKVDTDGPTVEYNGKLYAFCCPGCDAKFEKNPDKYSKNLSEDGTKYIGRK